MTVDITGFCPDRFSAVRDAFAANFEDGGELGARFSLAIHGEVVVDLMGGFAGNGMGSTWFSTVEHALLK